VTLAPQGGVIDSGDGGQAILEGVMINHYDPFEGGYGQNVSLTQATDDIARQITQSNSYLRAAGAKRTDRPGCRLLDGVRRHVAGHRAAGAGHADRASWGTATCCMPC
jgi:hypothetical protein